MINMEQQLKEAIATYQKRHKTHPQYIYLGRAEWYAMRDILDASVDPKLKDWATLNVSKYDNCAVYKVDSYHHFNVV